MLFFISHPFLLFSLNLLPSTSLKHLWVTANPTIFLKKCSHPMVTPVFCILGLCYKTTCRVVASLGKYLQIAISLKYNCCNSFFLPTLNSREKKRIAVSPLSLFFLCQGCNPYLLQYICGGIKKT